MSLFRGTYRLYTDNLYAGIAAKYSLPLPLVLAVVQKESSFQVAAYNPEPPYRYFFDVRLWKPWREPTAIEIASEVPPADFPSPPGVPRDAEWWGQQASFGLMQVMGGVAREEGCYSFFLTELCADPVLAVDIGCKHLKRKLDKYGTIPRALAAYNAGSPRIKPGTSEFENQEYVDAVVGFMRAHEARIAGG